MTTTRTATKQRAQTFSDPSYGFTFSYPANWSVAEKGAAVVIRPRSQRGRQGCEIIVDKMSAAEFAEVYGPAPVSAGAREFAKVYLNRVREEGASRRIRGLASSGPRARKCGDMDAYQVSVSYSHHARAASVLQEYSRSAPQQKKVVFATAAGFVYRLENHCKGPAHLADKHAAAFAEVLKSFRVG